MKAVGAAMVLTAAGQIGPAFNGTPRVVGGDAEVRIRLGLVVKHQSDAVVVSIGGELHGADDFAFYLLPFGPPSRFPRK